MVTILSRIIHYGLTNFWRNGWLSMTTVAIMIIALMVFVSLILFGVVTDRATASIQDRIDISVYFKSNVPEDQILNVKQSLESLAQVKSVDYISQDQALQTFKDIHKDDQVVTEAVNTLTDNPLQASLDIKAKKPDQYALIAQYFDTPELKQFVDSVSYTKNQVVIDRLSSIVRNVNRIGFSLIVFLTAVAGLVVFNTIRLAIYSNREEIGIMRVVGASNSLVRGPYVVEGIMMGAVAAVISIILLAPFIYMGSPYLKVFIPGLNMFQYFYTHILNLLLYGLAFGVVIGGLSSFVAVRRYLRN